jgi:two-component system OmpR family sensor kinase
MTLRLRLIIAFTALLLVVIVVVGFVAVRSTRRVLIAQIDDRIAVVMNQLSRRDTGRRLLGQVQMLGSDRFLAELVLDAGGGIVASSPSGLEGDPDPLPDTAAVARLAVPSAQIITIDAVDGNFDYRAGVIRTANGTLIFAQPLRDVTAATRAISRRLLWTGSLVLVVGGGAVWFTVRRGMRPVDDMIETASAIAAGDLTRRVPPADPESELGRLGGALNNMLASIEGAFSAEALAKDRLKQFVADASHELRTPLAAIAGYSELHRKGAFADPEQADHAMRRIEAEGRRMRRLVDDLLLLARLDLADDQIDSPLHRQPTDISGIARDAVADSLAIDPGHPVTMEAPAPLWIDGDPERLAQVVANLLSNVRSHTPSGTMAVLKLRRDGAAAAIEIRDDGPGFPPEAIDHVFDRFYRVDSSRSRRSGGAGLGLAIVDAIVRAHGGSAEANNLPGGGARITVRLPLADTP